MVAQKIAYKRRGRDEVGNWVSGSGVLCALEHRSG